MAKGDDPGLIRKKAKVAAAFSMANTFQTIAEEYIETKMVREGAAEETIVKARWFLGLLKPAIDSMPITEVDPQMLLAPLKKMEARGTLETAKKCRSFVNTNLFP